MIVVVLLTTLLSNQCYASSFAREYIQLQRLCLDFDFDHDTSPLDRGQSKNAIKERLAEFVAQKFTLEELPYPVIYKTHCFDQPPRTFTLRFQAALRSDPKHADSRIGVVRVIGRFSDFREDVPLEGFNFDVQLFRCDDSLEACVSRELERYFSERLIPIFIEGRKIGRR